ncbi:MAG TPA: thioredoxin domain-containing protein [Caldilineaceae bacterium]|nr:thioredoxin domain-containing protein [Caldilineaceae bacterium]
MDELHSQTSPRTIAARISLTVTLLVVVVALISCTPPIQAPGANTAEGSQATAESATSAEAVESSDTVNETEPTTDVANEADSNEAVEPVEAMPTVNPPEGTYKGIPVGFTQEGFPYRGSPDAPIVMYEYSDFQCPFCSRYFVQTEPAIDESYVRSGQVRVVFRDFPLAQLHPNAPAAHVASLCAADQGIEAYWQMHSRLFQTQSEWNESTNAQSYFSTLAEELGLDMESYQACVESGEKEALVAQGVMEAQALGFNGTPSFHIVRDATNDAYPLIGAQPYDQFAAILDALIAGETPQVASEESGSDGGGNGEIPYWATAEGLQPDPDRPGYTMAGDEYRGNPEAAVVVIEFSDFQCPFCRRHVQDTQPTLDEKFVETDQIFWVFKHFPLSIHPQAPAAGVAAECAANQDNFWEMHELLFERLSDWSISNPNPIFVELAGELGLDVDAFTSCLDDETVAQRVQEDMNAGAAFVRGTPTFIVLHDGQGSIIPGALPVERFTEILQQVLDGSAG